jgi:hypothetical protein
MAISVPGSRMAAAWTGAGGGARSVFSDVYRAAGRWCFCAAEAGVWAATAKDTPTNAVKVTGNFTLASCRFNGGAKINIQKKLSI